MPPELVELVERNVLPRGGRAVDVGCGAGLEAVYLAAEGFRVLGVDLSLSALVRARRRGLEAQVGAGWCAGRARSLPLATESVDLLLDRGCFHLFEPDTRPAYAAEITRVLRPEGRVLLRGARDDDEERGVFGMHPQEIDGLFPRDRFHRSSVVSTRLEAPAGDLEGRYVLLCRRSPR